MANPCVQDSYVSLISGGCRGQYDFSVAFENYILILIPAACLLLSTPVRIRTVWARSIKVVRPSILQTAKSTAAFCFLAFSFALLVFNASSDDYNSGTELAASLAVFLAAIACFALSYIEHQRSLRPSTVLQLYLLVALIVQVIHLRTIWLRRPLLTVRILSLCQAASCASFLASESVGKDGILLSSGHKTSPEDFSGLFSKRLFLWLNALYWRGYGKVLAPNDLFHIDNDLSSSETQRRFRYAWLRQTARNKNTPLFIIACRALPFDTLFPVAPRLLLMSMTLSQPFLIQAFIRFIEAPGSADRSSGPLLVLATAIVYFCLATFRAWYKQTVNRFTTKLRGCLITAIYDKSLRTRRSASSSPLMLMNVDVEKIMFGLREMHEFWACLIETGIAMYLVYTQLGLVFLAPTGLVLVLMTIVMSISGRVRPKQLVWLAATQTRVGFISEVIDSMKNLKLLGLSERIEEIGTRLRDAEVDAHTAIRKVLFGSVIISLSIFQSSTLITYSAFALRSWLTNDATLTNANLFTSLAVLKLLNHALIGPIQAIPAFLQALAAFGRIQKYLLSPEHEDRRSIAGAEEPYSWVSDNVPAITIERVSCGYDSEHNILHDVSCQFKADTMTMVIGSVGSGKSTFLKLVMGEAYMSEGAVRVAYRDVAFCEQTPWLWNGTVQENIVGMENYDKVWFDTVAHACALDEDFAQLPMGSRTMVGSSGTALSGGQKNRVSLARAVYSRKKVQVLDDSLAGLDTRTEAKIFQRVLGADGLLRRNGCTVLLASHAIGWLSQMDNVLVIDSGKCLYQGMPQKIPASIVPAVSSAPEHHEEDSAFTAKVKQLVAEEEEEAADDPTEELKRLRKGLDRDVYKIYLSSFSKLNIAIYFFLTVASVGTVLVQGLCLKFWAGANATEDTTLGMYVGVFITISILAIGVLSAWIAFGLLYLLPLSSKYLHGLQWQTLVKCYFPGWGKKETGTVTNRFSQDIALIDGQLQMCFVNVTYSGFSVLGNTALLIVATPHIAAALPLVVAAFYVVQAVYLRTSKQLRVMDLEAKAPLCTHFLETVAGVVTIIGFGQAEKYREKNTELLEASQIPHYLLQSCQYWLDLVLNLIVAGMATVLVGVAIALDEQVDAGFLGLALLAIMDLGLEIANLVDFYTQLETSLGAVQRIREFIAQTPIEEQGRLTPPPDWPAQGSVELKNVMASYATDADPTLKDLSLHIPAGQKLAITGRTGSGKSSFTSSVFGLLHLQSGCITIDSVPITEINQNKLRSELISLPQDPYFLPGTVRENLLTRINNSGSPVSDETVLAALSKVGLRTKLDALAERSSQPTWVSTLDMPLEANDMLTRGQQQLFALARALLTPGKILVLDEATSGLDRETEKKAVSLVETEFKDRTVVAIAHHLSTIMGFDRVLVMAAGEIVEDGPPRELAQREGSVFGALVKASG